MMCIKQLAGIIMISASISSYAGVAAPTAHSRANCGGFNESITWQLGHSYWWRVESHHFLSIGDARPNHVINTGKNMTWRAAAYHATEGYSTRGDRWYVAGYHFYYPNGREVLDVTTMAIDCSIYDGWWDH
jgi:hypothetical protein